MAQKTYQIGRITGYGRTKTEARAAAEEKAAQMSLNVDMGPAAFTMPALPCPEAPLACVVTSDSENSWSYYWIEGHQSGDAPRAICGGFESRIRAVYAAVEHLIGLFVGADTTAADLDRLEIWIAKVLCDKGQAVTLRAGARDRANWQRRYRDAAESGQTANEAHATACAG